MPKKERDEHETLDAELEHETEKAWLLYIDDEKYWIPKSIGEWDERSETVTIPTWFYKRMQPVED